MGWAHLRQAFVTNLISMMVRTTDDEYTSHVSVDRSRRIDQNVIGVEDRDGSICQAIQGVTDTCCVPCPSSGPAPASP